METRLERTRRALLGKAQQIIDRAEQEQRERTAAEDADVKKLLDDAERIKQEENLQDEVAAVGKAIGPGEDSSGVQDGWAKVAQQIAAHKATSFEVPGATLLRGAGQQQLRGKDLTATEPGGRRRGPGAGG